MRSSSIFLALLQLEATWAQHVWWGGRPPPPGCPGCPFNVQALEDFKVDYTAVEIQPQFDSQNTLTGFTTTPMSAQDNHFADEHGTIALNAHRLQLKYDVHVHFAQGVSIGPVPLGGAHIQEELHIDAAASRASYHLSSPMLNVCFQLDHLPPVPENVHGMVQMYLQQGEQMGPAMIQQMGTSLSVDGERVVGVVTPTHAGVFFTESTHPKLLIEPTPPRERRMVERLFQPPPPQELLNSGAAKFHGYENSVGESFAVRACGIEDHSATQSLLEANPEVREFVASRLVHHQSRLKGLVQPVGLNTRFNLIPLEIADLMVPPAEHCANEELAQIPRTASTLEVAAVSVCSFVMGIAVVFAVLRKKTVTPADDYHQVSA